MRSRLFLDLYSVALVMLACSTFLSASASAKDCHLDNARVSRIVNGIKITIEPKSVEGDNVPVCRASLTKRDGTTLTIGTDFDITFLPATGKDVNEDGQPDAVLEGWSGGAHCCYTYWVVSLGDTPYVIRKIYNEDHIKFVDLNNDGKTELLTTEGVFDYYDELCYACSPFVQVVLRLKGNTLSSVGSEFWPRYQRVIQSNMDALTPEVLREFRTTRREDFHADWEETKSKIFVVALSYLYAGKEDDALQFLITAYGRPRGAGMKEVLLKQAKQGFLGDPRSSDFGCRDCRKYD